MTEIRIRDAGLEDIGMILEHRRAMFWDMGRQSQEGHRRMRDSAEAFLRDAMPRGHYRGFFAETADRRIVAGVGIAIVPWPGSPDDSEPRRAWVQNVYTLPEFRGQGLARRLMERAIEWCRAEGFLNLALHASPQGRPLYESLGFLQTNEMRLRLR